jgi:hypothetical protein
MEMALSLFPSSCMLQCLVPSAALDLEAQDLHGRETVPEYSLGGAMGVLLYGILAESDCS